MSRDLAFKRRFETALVSEPKYNEVYDMLKDRIKNLSKYHNISIDRKLIDYIILSAFVFNLTGHNPDKTLDLCDRSMAIAKMRNSDVLEKSDVDKVYEENYEKYDKLPYDEKRATAYHEAAHYVIALETRAIEHENPIAITIVPSNGSYGAYLYEYKDDSFCSTQDSYMGRIYSLLAGRMSQEIYLNQYWDDGATSDIQKATNIAVAMLTKNSLCKYSSADIPLIFDEEYKYVSDGRKDLITEMAEEIISKATGDVYQMLYKKDVKEKIEKVANLLLEKKIVSAKELQECVK